MTLQDQTFLSNKTTGVKGNCLMACYASYLNLPLEECPQIQYLFDCKPDGFWDRVLNLWLNELGYKEVHYPPEYDPAKSNHEGFYFAYGMSDRGFCHQVIYKNSQLFHDPNPAKTGLTSITGFVVLEKYLKTNKL